MNVNINDIKKLIKNYSEKIIMRKTISTADKTLIKSGDALNIERLTMLSNEGYKEADIVYSKDMLFELSKINGAKYRNAYACESLSVIGKQIRYIQDTKKNSERKRCIYAAEEIYKAPEKGDYTILLKYGEEFKGKKWHLLKKRFGVKKQIGYRFNETGIIALIDLRPRGDDYLKRFYKNSNLVTLLVGKDDEKPMRIAPDLAIPEDIHTVDNHKELLEKYKETNTRLVIVGDALSEDYKKALGSVKQHDKYARFMLASNVDLEDKDEFFRQVALNYHRIPWARIK